mgnify:CR=1 FL=1
MSKKYDVAVKVGEYQKDGQTKGRYMNVGAVLQGKDGPYLVLDRTFNPAGVPNPENRSNLILSLFAPKDGQQPQQQAAAHQPAPAADFDDDLPFK